MLGLDLGDMMSKWNNGASWAAAMALAVGVSSGASAADLGGNCCADLEERIAELEATTARKGTRKVSLEISGWLNKTILFWDDSIRSDVYAGIDNDAASSRWRFVGSAMISPDVTAGFQYEFSSVFGLTSSVNQANGGDDRGYFTDAGGSINTVLRQANVWLESKRLGRVTLGVASQATDGIAEIDLSRTEVVAGSNVDSWIAGFKLVVNGLYTTTNAIEIFSGNQDGGRDQLIRYDSPIFAGFRLSASVSGGTRYPQSALGQLPPVGPERQEWDIALRYAGEFNGVRVATGIGYHEGSVIDATVLPNNTFVFNKTLAGSAAFLHVPSGLFLTLAGGHREYDDATPIGGAVDEYVYAKSGVLANFLPVGQTAIYGEYFQQWTDTNNGILFPGPNYSAKVWGAGIVQHIDGAAMEIYAAYRFYDSPDLVGLEFGDFHMGQVGMRIKF